jgi:uncharacterized protein (DUF1330 family)
MRISMPALGLVTFGVAIGAAGAVGTQSLRAQSASPAYFIGEVNVTDKDNYAKEFVPLAAKAIADHGGKYIVRGGKTVSLQGSPPASRVVVLQFENMDKAQAWWDSADRKSSQEVGNKYGTFRTFFVEGATSQ